MNLSASKRSSITFLLCSFLLLILGAWYRYHISGMIYLEDDSDHYLIPAIRKAFTGEWHKGERPMQYLLFIYYTLSGRLGIQYTIILQQVLGIISAGFLTIAWITFISGYNRYNWLWRLLGYGMIGVYVSSPVIMYYEQMLAPESFCIFVMSALICCLTFVFYNSDAETTPSAKVIFRKTIFLSIALFLNLYLGNPLTKWAFASFFLEVLLVYALIKQQGLLRRTKLMSLLVPHLLYLALVWLPETMHKTDLAKEDRVYIEFEQMAYSHFDLLAQDKTNFGLTPSLQDSLVEYLKDAARPTYLMKFSNDELMWGRASAIIEEYYHGNYDSIKNCYIELNLKLVTKYPLGLTREVGRQLLAFYIPNFTIHKDLFNSVDFTFSYNENERIINRIKPAVANCADLPAEPGWNQPVNSSSIKSNYQIVPAYPSSLSAAQVYNPNNLPLIFTRGFWFYRFFSPLFLALMFTFFVIRIHQQKLLQIHIITLLYLLIFIYVLTIAIVHTFDCTRFVITIYPFLLISTCMAMAYITDFVLSKAIRK